MMTNSQPSKALAIAQAEYLWKLYGITGPDVLVLEDLALAMGILVLRGKLDSADARMIRKGKQGLIRVNESIPEPGRERFAVAHEIGHWVLHERISQLLACTADDMVQKYKASVPEIEANYFASGLLMPEHLFLRQIDNKRPSFDLIKRLADYFGTTLTATAIRYVDILNDYCAVVCSENGRIRWWRGSSSFEDKFWLDAGTTLAGGTLAAALFRGEPISPRPQKVDLSAWLKEEVYGEEDIFEQSILLERYKQVLSLIWLP